MSPDTSQIHGSAVAVDGRGCLILGAPGAGKSALVLDMIAVGAALVADDRVEMTRRGPEVWLAPPKQTAGLLEARGIGLLRLPWAAEARLALIVDLNTAPNGRLPPRQIRELLGVPIPIIHAKGVDRLSAKLVVALRGSILDPDAPFET